MPDGAIARHSPASRLNHAIDLDRAGETRRARELMRGLSEAFPDWDEPAMRLTESLRAMGEQSAAMDACRAVLRRNPNREQALLAVGAMSIEAGAPGEAIAPLLRCCGCR